MKDICTAIKMSLFRLEMTVQVQCSALHCFQSAQLLSIMAIILNMLTKQSMTVKQCS